MDIAQFHKEQEKFKIQREKMYKEKIANLEFKQYTELVGILNKSNSELSQNIIYQKNKLYYIKLFIHFPQKITILI